MRQFLATYGLTIVIAGVGCAVLAIAIGRAEYADGLAAGRAECQAVRDAHRATLVERDNALGETRRSLLAECSEQVVALGDEVVERLRVIERRHKINPHLLDSLRVDP